jgi:hypothetical protein
MWIVAIGWIYVVALMAATQSTVFAGIMTFFGYCVLPLSLVVYLTGSKRRRARREIAAASNEIVPQDNFDKPSGGSPFTGSAATVLAPGASEVNCPGQQGPSGGTDGHRGSAD